MESLKTAREIAAVLNLPLESVWRLTRENVLPHYQVGHLFRYDLDKVMQAMNPRKEN